MYVFGALMFAFVSENSLTLQVSHIGTSYKIYNMSGIEVMGGLMGSSVESESMLGLSSGMYVVRFYDEESGWQKVQKVFKH